MKSTLERFRFFCAALIMCASLLLTNWTFSQSRAAASMYRVACQSLPKVTDFDEFTIRDVFDAPLDDHAKEIISQNAKSLSEFDAASQMPFGDWGFSPDDTTYAGKTLSGADVLTDIVVLRARIRAANSQYAQALNDCANIATLARRFSVQPSLRRQVLQDQLFDKALSAAGLFLADAPAADVQRFMEKLGELRAPADPIDVALAQKQAYIWFYRKVIDDPDLRLKLDNAINSVGEVFGIKSDPVDVSDLVTDPAVGEQVFADTESAFNNLISAMKLPESERTAAVEGLIRRLHSYHPLVRGATQMVGLSYRLSLVEPMKVDLLRTAAKIYAELPRPIDENLARQHAGSYQYSRTPGGFELIGTIQGVDQSVVVRVGARPIRLRPTTEPSQAAH